MALTVETGAGLSNADSYLSIADADTYCSGHGLTAWADATEAAKEIALRSATQYIDSKYRGCWKGVRANEDQALAWPRASVVDSDGYVIDSESLPENLKDATAEGAYRALSESLFPDIDNNGSIKSEAVTVGPIEEKIEYQGGKGLYKSYGIIAALLRDFVYSSNRAERA